MIRVYFDTTEVNGNYILGLSQSVQPYSQRFCIGNTICRQFELDVKNAGFVSIPQSVVLKEYNGTNETVYATLVVDSYENRDEDHTLFTLTDIMVRMNKQLVYNSGDTVADIIQSIADEYGVQHNFANCYMDDYEIAWYDELTQRDFLSYVAEVNGGYVYIDANSNICLGIYSTTSAGTVDVNMCSSFRVGEEHIIDRVYVELASATQYYPATNTYETIYLNSSNILINTSTSSDILQNVYSVINGFTFYDIEIDRCPVLPNVRAGQIITVDSKPFICSVDFGYNAGWYGGYKSVFDNRLQDETQVVSTKELVRRVDIKVDRVTGEITQTVTDVTNNIATVVQQTSESLEARVARVETDTDNNNNRLSTIETSVAITASGVTVSQGTQGSYTRFTDSGMEIYIESIKQAWATSEGFASEELIVGGSDHAQKWHIHMSNDGESLTFLRRQ